MATGGVLGYVCLRWMWFVQIFVTEENKAARHAVADVSGVAISLPLVLAIVWIAARGERTTTSWWLLSALAAVAIAVSVPGGVLWLVAAQFLSGAILIVVPIRWAAPLFASMVAAAVLVSYAENQRQWACYMGMTTLVGGLTLAILVWLTRTVRQAEVARLQLADQAVIAERLRIDAELTRSVTGALEAIIVDGERVAQASDPDDIVVALAALVAFSRHTLTQTRRMLAGYQVASAETELQTAVTLLAGAGVHASVVLPGGGALGVLGERARVQLRSAVAGILADDTVEGCVITLTSAGAADDDELRFDVRRYAKAGVR